MPRLELAQHVGLGLGAPAHHLGDHHAVRALLDGLGHQREPASEIYHTLQNRTLFNVSINNFIINFSGKDRTERIFFVVGWQGWVKYFIPGKR